jgi:hypothetical protein
MDKPTKTFGIHAPSDLLHKLAFDLERLKRARSSNELRYAAFDCAVGSWHLVDWTLHTVSKVRCLELCGVSAGQRGSSTGFIARNTDRVPHLAECQQIANTGKHMVLTMATNPDLIAGSTVLMQPPFDLSNLDRWKDTKFIAFAYVQIGDYRSPAATFFNEMLQGWSQLLEDEGLMRDVDPELRNVFS